MWNPLLKIEFLREGRGARLPLLIIFYNAILALVTIMIMLVNNQSYMEGYFYDPATSRLQFVIISTIQLGFSLLLSSLITWSLYVTDQEGGREEPFSLVPGYYKNYVMARLTLVVMINILLFLSSLPVLLLSATYSGVTLIQTARLGMEIAMCSFWSTALTGLCCALSRKGFFSAFLTILMEVFFLIGTYVAAALFNGRFMAMGAENILSDSGHMVYNAATVLTMLVMSLNPISAYMGYRINISGDSGFFRSFCAGFGLDTGSRFFSYIFYKMSAAMLILCGVIMVWITIRLLTKNKL